MTRAITAKHPNTPEHSAPEVPVCGNAIATASNIEQDHCRLFPAGVEISMFIDIFGNVVKPRIGWQIN